MCIRDRLQTAAEAANAEVSAGELEEDYDISDEDVLQNEIFTAEEPDGTETAAVTDGSAETAAGTEGEPAAEGTGQTVADGTAGDVYKRQGQRFMMSCSEALQHYSVQSERIYCGNISFCARFLR